MTCEHCQQQLLPYLYDLLESGESAEIASHLEECAECRHALTMAQGERNLLAAAVKEEHGEVVFQAPTQGNPASTMPTVALRRPARRAWLIGRWAAAAAVVFVCASTGTLLAWRTWRNHDMIFQSAQASYAKAKNDLAKSQEDLERNRGKTQDEIRKIQKQFDALLVDWKRKEADVRQKVEDKQAKLPWVNIIGPPTLQAGATTNYIVEVQSRLPGNIDQQPDKSVQKKGDPAAQQEAYNFPPMQAQLRNLRNNEIVYQQSLKIENNRASLNVPSTVPFKPGDELAMEFLAQINGKYVPLPDNLTLATPEYVTHVTTDRPLYRPGDMLRFRSLTLERFSLKPASEKLHLRYRVLGPKNEEVYRQEFASLLAGPNNELIKGPDGRPLAGVGVGEFKLPGDLPAGRYTLSVAEVNDRFNEEKRSFLVQRWQPFRFTKELTFDRPSYSAGDTVKMKARFVPIQRPGVGAGKVIDVRARVTIDGNIVLDQAATTDQDGRIALEFDVPRRIEAGIGIVKLTCEEGGNPESLVQSLPLAVRNLDVEFYPEGGDLIAGIPNRVYFQARSPSNKAIDFSGRIFQRIAGKETEVARIETMRDAAEPAANQGMGHFTFTPATGSEYILRIESPVGIERTFTLPAVRPFGVVMSIPEGVVQDEINVFLQSSQQRRAFLVGAYCRGRLVAHQFTRAGADQPVQVTLKPIGGAGGVHRITVFEMLRVDQELIYRPIAERLIYRKNAMNVNIEMKPDRASYQPGDTVRLALQARNEKNVLTPTIAMLAVVDSNVLKSADEKTARTMPTHFLLTTEVKNPEDLENADFLLTDHPKAETALDLLLGCQGWRRFAEQDPQKFAQDGQGRGQRAPGPQRQGNPNFLANVVNPVAQILNNEQKEIEKLDDVFVREAITLQQKLADFEQRGDVALPEQEKVDADRQYLQNEAEKVVDADRQITRYRLSLIHFGLGGGVLIFLSLGFVLISVGLHRVSSDEEKPRAWLSSGIGVLGLLFLGSVIGAITFLPEVAPQHMEVFKLGVDLVGGPIVAKDVNWQKLPDEEPGDVEAPPLQPENPLLPADKPAKPVEAKKKRDAAGNPVVQPLDLVNNKFAPALNLQGQRQDIAPLAELDERQLRQEGNYHPILVKHLGRRVQLPAAQAPCVVREYAHRRQAHVDGLRRDLTETVCWRPVFILPDGKADISFDLNDASTNFEIVVFSHTLDGRLGANRIEVVSRKPGDPQRFSK